MWKICMWTFHSSTPHFYITLVWNSPLKVDTKGRGPSHCRLLQSPLSPQLNHNIWWELSIGKAVCGCPSVFLRHYTDACLLSVCLHLCVCDWLPCCATELPLLFYIPSFYLLITFLFIDLLISLSLPRLLPISSLALHLLHSHSGVSGLPSIKDQTLEITPLSLNTRHN